MELSEIDAKELIQHIVECAGFDSFKIHELLFNPGFFGLALMKNGGLSSFAAVSSNDGQFSWHNDIFRFTSSLDVRYLSCLIAILSEEGYVFGYDFDDVCILKYPNETLESLMIRLDLNGA